MKKKISNSFASYQEQKQRRREDYILAYLVVARKSRQRFDYVTDMAKSVASYITTVETQEGMSNSACNPATLLRNKRYSALLHSYLRDNVHQGIKNAPMKKNHLSPVEQSNSLLSGIETSNLRLENQRLKYHIVELERALAHKAPRLPPIGTHSPEVPSNLQDMEFKFISTCQMLSTILSKLQDILIADAEKQRILDATVRRGDNVLVDERIAAPFFDWLKGHAANMLR